ncbi:MAG: hypothetical protein WCI04_01765 [archaeon]
MDFAKKSALIAIVLVMTMSFFGTAHALDYQISQHTINVQISTDSKDTVVEKFFISFPNDTEKINFRENSLQLGTSIDEWKKLNTLFIPSFGENTQNKKIAYNEGDQSYLQISYDLTDTLMAKGKEATMLTEYSLKVNYFNSFYQAGLWTIPENTSINIDIPAGAEIRNAIEPQATTSKNGTRTVVTWQGYKSANKLSLTYVVWKKITPVIDLNATTNFLFKTQAGMLFLLAVVIILIVTAWQRKKIGAIIEDFVEKHSVIKEE